MEGLDIESCTDVYSRESLDRHSSYNLTRILNWLRVF